jgi:hypothetical protein
MNEQEQFLKSLEQDVTEDPFAFGEHTEEKKEETTDSDDPEVQPESIKDRRHRRLEDKLRAEREANIALTERLKVLAETNKTVSETSDSIRAVERIYGTDSPEAVAATELLKQALLGVKEEAKREALETIQQERLKEREEVAKEEESLNAILEDLEDEYGADLTSAKGEATRKSFFKLLEKMSPKDSEGNVIAYADHRAVWEEYQTRASKKPDTRAKDLAARSMTQSGAQTESKLEDDATLRFLKENGLI